MAQLASNPPKHDLHLSQVLPTVKCSSCNHPVPLDHLCDHRCPTTSPPMPPPSNTAHRNPGGTRSPIAITPVNPPVLRRQQSASLRANPNPVVPSRGAPSPAPLRKDVRSPGPPNSVMPPSRTQGSFTPTLASSPSAARQPTPRQSDNWPNVIPGNIQPPARFRAQSNAPVRLAPVDARSRSHSQHHPPPSSGLAQRSPSVQRPRPLGGGVPSEPGHLVRSLTSPPHSTHSSLHVAEPQIDTQSGGMAGMAGVGRRGFAAAARAAMFVAPRLQPSAPMSPPPALWNPASSGRVMNGSRVDGPPLAVLNPSAAPQTPYSLSQSPSPISLPSHSSSQDPWLSSNNPHFHSPASSVTLQPHRHRGSADSGSSSIPFPVTPSEPSRPSKPSGPLTPTSPTASFSSSDRSSQKKALVTGNNVKVVTQDDMDPSFLGRTADDDDGSEPGGLAYADGDESDDDALIMRGMGSTPAQLHHSPSASSTYSDDLPQSDQVSAEDGLHKAMAALLLSPTSTNEVLSPASSAKALPRASKPPMRSLTSHAQRDSSTAGGPIGRRGATISGAIGGSSPPEKSRKDRQSQESSATGLAEHRTLKCRRCTKVIEDRRWIRVEGGGVLCDKCWKSMYLPKCRRCNMPIEKQAVSSSDGQLKGKYHRECFNCHRCHKPFPDKTFYVFDGKPFCDYHYHEANNSLCAAPDCGRPIEGPCAVLHAGERYHPDHLTCDYEDEKSGKRCHERLVDYWEIEGRMLCDRHVRVVEQDLMGVDLHDGRIGADSRAMKRKTQFIDIAGLR